MGGQPPAPASASGASLDLGVGLLMSVCGRKSLRCASSCSFLLPCSVWRGYQRTHLALTPSRAAAPLLLSLLHPPHPLQAEANVAKAGQDDKGDIKKEPTTSSGS